MVHAINVTMTLAYIFVECDSDESINKFVAESEPYGSGLLTVHYGH